MKELKEITDEIAKQSNELLEYLEENAEFEEIQRELAELKQQQQRVNKIMLLGTNVTALYGLMLVVRMIIITIQ